LILFLAVVVAFNQSTHIVNENDGQAQVPLLLNFAVTFDIALLLYTNNETAGKY